jgi:serine/threonine-protein kinase
MHPLVPNVIGGLRAMVRGRRAPTRERHDMRETRAGSDGADLFDDPRDGRRMGALVTRVASPLMLACRKCRTLYPNDATECVEHGAELAPIEELPEEDPPLEPGTMVGEYQVERKLGSGTFGDVYAGEQPLIGKHVAIKVLHRKFASNSGVVARFVAEARAVNRIRHQNIIDIFSFGLHGEQQPYFVMERLDGMTLGELLDHEKRLAVADAVPILRGIAAGLDAAHEAGITHRDLKPDNIFLVKQKEGGWFPKLLDFGVAKLVSDDMAHKTATGAAIGTPIYMAPEQCRGKPVDHRADIYALGVVIHEVLTGRRLFQADSAMEVLFKHVSEPPEAMSLVNPELPKELDAPVLSMLAKSPNARPGSAGEAVAALIERAAAIGIVDGGAATPASDPSSFERALAKRDAATVADTHAPAAETSSPVVITVAPSEGDAASARTVLAASSAASGTLVSGGKPAALTPTVAMPPAAASERPEAAPSDAPPPRPEPPPRHAPPSRTPAWPFAAVAAAAAIAAVIATQRGGGKPATGAAESASVAPSAAPAATPAKVTIRLTVTPPDADVILDGMRVGAARDPLVLPRSDQTRAIRVEKAGFEAQALWIVPDRDLELPPIALRAAPAPVAPASASAAPPKTPIVKPHDDLERPVYKRPK